MAILDDESAAVDIVDYIRYYAYAFHLRVTMVRFSRE